MEVEFKKRQLRCLDICLQEARGAEQTLEIRLGEEMPDVGRILTAWGQPILRSKEWDTDSVSCSAGMMVWVLYAPEDGSHPKVLEGWLPFQLRWDLPEGTGEGKLALDLRTRFVDARTVSARKILVRGAISAWAKAMVPIQRDIFFPGEIPQGVQLKKATLPLLIPREAGEKRISIAEDLTIPGAGEKPLTIASAALYPELQEAKVIPSRVIIRGMGNLHLCCQGEDGAVRAYDFQIPFSQYAALDEMLEEGQAQVRLAVTALEAEPGENGAITVKGTILAQYTTLERQLVETVEDGYCPGRSMELHSLEESIPAILETREERLPGAQKLPCQAEEVLEIQLLPDHPRFRRQETGMVIEYPGMTQVLYRDREGQLQGASGRWELKQNLPCADGVEMEALLAPAAPSQVIPGKEELELQWQLGTSLTSHSAEPVAMVSGFALGEILPSDPRRPSLILKRTGEEGLWSLAKSTGSTMDSICTANHLTEPPKPGTLLLIPITG